MNVELREFHRYCSCHSSLFIMSSAESTTEKCKVALITGITGQDGSYLAELLLSKVGYLTLS